MRNTLYSKKKILINESSLILDNKPNSKNSLISSEEEKNFSYKKNEEFFGFECLEKVKDFDNKSEIVYNDCNINYIFCPNKNCIKNLI